jgi:hypothetical protein
MIVVVVVGDVDNVDNFPKGFLNRHLFGFLQ